MSQVTVVPDVSRSAPARPRRFLLFPNRTALSWENEAMNPISKLSGIAIAAAAASLFLAGTAAQSADTQSSDSGTVKVKCYGANACKGQAECKTSMNSCKGHNSCKGQGFMQMSEKACVERLGRQG